jgi:hypothetical protein
VAWRAVVGMGARSSMTGDECWSAAGLTVARGAPRTGWADRLRRQGWHPFRVSAAVALSCAVAVAVSVAHASDLALAPLAAVAGLSIGTFVVLALATKVVSGNERLVYLRHHLLATTASAIWLHQSGIDPLPHLDALTLGIGALLAVGRLGCAAVGCCHGLPCRRGIRYGEREAAEGFPPFYVGVRLFPLPLVEGAFAAALVALGWAIALADPSVPGAATAVYFTGYVTGRHFLEYGRGDAGRPHLAGFSEAQWTAVVVLLALAAFGAAGALPTGTAPAWPLAAILASMVAVTVGRRTRAASGDLTLLPSDVSELAGALGLLASREEADRDVHVAVTSRGLRLSASRPAGAALHHYAVSNEAGPLGQRGARRVANVILLLRHPRCRSELRAGSGGVFHLLVSHVANAGAARSEDRRA